MAPRRIWLLATLLALASARSEGGSEGGDPGASDPNAEVSDPPSEDQNSTNQAGSESDSAPSVCLAWGQPIFVAPCGVHPNDIQCGDCADDRALPLLNFKTTYTEHKKKMVTGGDLVVDIPIELLDGCGFYNTSKPRGGICGASAATLFKTSIDEAWLELRHPMLGGLPAYDCVTDGECNYPNGGRENMTNMKDVAAAACSANTDCVGFQWLKEVSVTFKTSKTMSSSTKFNNFYEKIIA